MKRNLLSYLEEAHEEIDLEARAIPSPAVETLPHSRKDEDDYIAFAERIGKRTLESFRQTLIVNHFDSDGISSGSIIALALREHKIPFRVFTVKKMTDAVIKQVAADPAKFVIFSDIGTGFLQQINDLAIANKKTILQIDHHAPEKIENKTDAFTIVNCHDFGIDGSFYACSSSSAYFVFSPHCTVLVAKKIAQLGIVGAVGDIQDVLGMRGLNRAMLDGAKKIKTVNVIKDLRLFGRVSRTLVNFLNFSSDPYLPGLTGNPKNCALFLRKNHLPLYREENGKRIWLRYYDLPRVERINLIGALMNYCSEKRISEEAVKSMLGDVYLFPDENNQTELYDAYEFSSLLNACGRENKPEIGIALCMGEPNAYTSAQSLLLAHRIEISKGINVARKLTEDMGAFYLLDARNEIPDSVIGTIAGSYFNSGTIDRTKPIIAFSIDEENNIKASSRAFNGLVEKGLDLGKVMSLSAKEAGGFGGGHSVAAGASIPNTQEAIRKFLLMARKLIKQQIGN